MPATDTALLHGFRLRNIEQNLGVYGIHLHREGHEPVEHRFRADDLVHLYSGSKTVTALAIGIARAEGLLDLDDAVISFFPGYRHAEGVETMTVRDLLRMASGNTFTWWGPGQLAEPDLLGAFLVSELVAEPGARFEYSNGCSYVLSRIIHAVSGQDLRDYLMSRLFEPLRISNPQWMRCPQGFSQGAIGLHLRTAQFARIGQLLLQGGRWDGDQLVPSEYITRMHTDLIDNTTFSPDPEGQAGYGYHVWRCTVDDAWRADGKYGQFSVVLPRRRAVVTITSHNEGVANDILRAVWEEVLPLLPEA